VSFGALQQLWKWAVSEEEVTASPMARMSAPIVPDQPVPVLDEQALRRLISACEGKKYADRRDTAIIRLLLDTGLCRGELANLTVDSIDLDGHTALVVGKGRRPRSVPFGRPTALALDRYLRVRGGHRDAQRPELWLGTAGRLTSNGVY
jgi:site-specific recombinase XerC